jgi:hypothetical protein
VSRCFDCDAGDLHPEYGPLLRKQRPETKVIVISGETATTIATENPADAFLRKPFIPPTLLQCIQRVLNSGFRGVCDEITRAVF